MDLEKPTFHSLERWSIICLVYFQIVSRSNFSRYLVATIYLLHSKLQDASSFLDTSCVLTFLDT